MYLFKYVIGLFSLFLSLIVFVLYYTKNMNDKH